MVAVASVAMVLFQDGGGGDQHRLTLYSLVIALALVAQAAGVCVAAAFAIKMFVRLDKLTGSFEQKTGPLIEKATSLVEELSPKLHSVVTNVEQTSYTVRVKVDDLAATVDDLNRTVQELNGRSRVQIARVDGMVSEALDSTQEISRTVQESIRTPVRQVAGVIAGLRAGLETLLARSPFRQKSDPDRYDL